MPCLMEGAPDLRQYRVVKFMKHTSRVATTVNQVETKKILRFCT